MYAIEGTFNLTINNKNVNIIVNHRCVQTLKDPSAIYSSGSESKMDGCINEQLPPY